MIGGREGGGNVCFGRVGSIAVEFSVRMCAQAQARARARGDRRYIPILPILPINIEISNSSMTYGDNMGGSIETEGSTDGSFTFADVQDRLVEAMIMLWRLPDREKGWFRRTAKDGPWDQIVAEWGDYADADAQPRMPGLTRAEIAEMEEALGWLRHVAADDRRVVGLAIVQLARGGREVSWSRMLKPMGLRLGSDGLRMRYGRALNAICRGENGGNPRAEASRP